MEKGWIDYLVPQIYWSLKLKVASHRVLLNWWAENYKNSNLYVGNGPYKVRNNSDKAWNKKKELPKQLRLARKTEAVRGNVFFSARSLMSGNKDIVNYIKKELYSYPSFTFPRHPPPMTTTVSCATDIDYPAESMRTASDGSQKIL